MITENISAQDKTKGRAKSQRILRINREMADGLMVSDGTEEMIFKRYVIDDVKMEEKLEKRYHLKHEFLINIYNIEYHKGQLEDGSTADQLNCGILFEKYIKTMQESIKEMIRFTHEEVISTFTPIKEVVDFMVYQNYDPGELNYSSIVCDQQYNIKFIDPFLHDSNLRFKERDGKLYEELAQLIFSLLFPEIKSAKTWKYKYQVAEKQLTTPHFHFFQEIYKKFASNSSKSSKSKQIKKQVKSKSSKIKSSEFISKNDASSPQKKSLHEVIINQSGKENQIVQ